MVSAAAPGPEGLDDRCLRLEAENRALRAMAARLFSQQEAERRAVARSLHDQAGQSLTAIRMAASAALDEADPVRRREDLEDILVQADAALAEARRLCNLLRPPQLDALGLEAALRGHVERLFADSDIALRLRMSPLPARPAADLEQACFRIAEDALDNALRHADAGFIGLSLDTADGWLQLEVQDDGRGFDPVAGYGSGLAAMRERARSVGGELSIHSAPGKGTRILARLPCPPAAGALPGNA